MTTGPQTPLVPPQPAQAAQTLTAKLPGGVNLSVSGLTLATVLFIGWEARGAYHTQMAAIEGTQARVAELAQASTAMAGRIGALEQTVAANDELRREFAAYRAEVDRDLGALRECARDRRKCRNL